MLHPVSGRVPASFPRLVGCPQGTLCLSSGVAHCSWNFMGNGLNAAPSDWWERVIVEGFLLLLEEWGSCLHCA